MDFLVHLTTHLPGGMDPADRADLVTREGQSGAEFYSSGVIRQIWRVPGRLENYGIWNCPDADALHAAITSLPAWPWMSVEVTPLTRHPLTKDKS
jgi:muconolactone D-isomerase